MKNFEWEFFYNMDISQTMSKVIVIDDDMSQRMILRMSLELDGYSVVEAENGFEAMEILSTDPDIRLMLTDLAMPKMDGYELIKTVREKELRYTYIIVLTSMEDRESLLKALAVGADDYLTKPVFPDELKLRLRGGTRLLKLESQEELIFSMAKLAESRSHETGYHLERVQHYTRILAKELSKNCPELNLSLSTADEFARVSTLHDIGKVAIPDEILHKPGQLTSEELDIMRKHAGTGGRLLIEIFQKTGSPYLWFAYEIAMFHHEKWDGTGYPNGYSGEDIPLSARIMSLADVYDALTSDRCYKHAFPHDKARSIIMYERGKHFDPRVVDAFLRQERQCLSVKHKFQD